MRSSGTGDRLTQRVKSLTLEADTFMDQKILGALLYVFNEPDTAITIEHEGERLVRWEMSKEKKDEP
jgi:hypothetical protein